MTIKIILPNYTTDDRQPHFRVCVSGVPLSEFTLEKIEHLILISSYFILSQVKGGTLTGLLTVI
jgi:hypothetical protein